MIRRQRIRSYAHRHKKELLLIVTPALLGILIFAGNFINYQNSGQIYTTSLDDPGEDVLRTSQGEPGRMSFLLDNHRDYAQINIRLRFKNISTQSQLDVEFNGRTIRDDMSNIQPGGTVTLTINQDRLQARNFLVLKPQSVALPEIVVQRISVEGHTTQQEILNRLLVLLAIILVLGPVGIAYYIRYRIRSALEDRFPDFLRDVVEGTRSGMSLPKAIKNTQSNDYGRLTPYVNGMAAKLDWGIPFERVLRDFGERSRSPIIRRSVNTIIQTYQSGGNVSNVLDSVGSNLKEIEKLKNERRSELYGELVTGYIVYAIFLIVLIVLTRYLIPAITFSTDLGPIVQTAGQQQSGDQLVQTYKPIFRHLVLLQSFFSGLIIGKLSRGTFKAGFKHILVLMVVGYLVATFLL
jgi:flagellar protein FlaJ